MAKTEKAREFSKEALVASNKYAGFEDFLQGNLEEGKTYTFKEVDDLLGKYYGKDE